MVWDLKHFLDIDLIEEVGRMTADEPVYIWYDCLLSRWIRKQWHFRGTSMNPWKLLAFINGLPDTSALAASLQGGHEYRGWGTDRHMRADMWDMKRVELHDRKKGKSPRYPRPGVKKEGKSLLAMAPPFRRKR